MTFGGKGMFDSATAWEETLRALNDLVRQGKVRYIGCSNLAGWLLMKALAVSEKQNLEKFVSLQAYYSLVNRELELDLMPLCLDQGLGILVWSPLPSGFLTGKYQRGQSMPPGTRRTAEERQFLQVDEEKGFDIIKVLEDISHKYNVTIAAVALNYLSRKPAITLVIIGARNQNQLVDNLKSGEFELSQEDMSRLDLVSELPRVYPYWMLQKWKNER
jgi:aryl-alcohol dehydrogenase-like predicted oxidoreductase